MFAVVLDTCVLWPSLQRDFLLSMAVEGLYRPLWSSAILAELEEHEAKKRVGRGEDAPAAQRAARHLITQMTGAFDDACVEGWQPLDGTYDLPDPDDEHLVAAAVVGGAGAIVTDNLKDLPADKIPNHIQVIPPAVFALETVEIDPAIALRALDTMAGRYTNPSRSLDELFVLLASRYGMEDTSALLKAALEQHQ